MLPEPLKLIVDDVEQDLERVYAEWCLEVQHPDLTAFVEHLLRWKLVSDEQARIALDAVHPADALVVDDPGPGPVPSIAFEAPTPLDTDELIEDPASVTVDVAATPGVMLDPEAVEEFDLFDEADMATVHDAAWPGRPVESDEVDMAEATSPQPVDERPIPPDDDADEEDAPAAIEPTVHDEGPQPLSPFTPDPDEEESISDLETVINRKDEGVSLGELETFVRGKGDESDLKSMITVVPAVPAADFDADTVQPADPLEGADPIQPIEAEPVPVRATHEAWGSSEAEADDTDTVTQAPPDLAADLLEGILDEDDPPTEDIDKADVDEPGEAVLDDLSDEVIVPSLAETRVPASRADEDDDAASGPLAETRVPAARSGIAEELTRPVGPVDEDELPAAVPTPGPVGSIVERLRNEPRMRVAALAGAALAVVLMLGLAWQIDQMLGAQAERQRQTFTRAVTVGATQATMLESAFVAGLGPLDATAAVLTEALENGPKWRRVVGRPPQEFRSENTLPEEGSAFDRSPAKRDGPRWVDLQMPAVVTPDTETQNPRWGIVSELFKRHLPPLLDDRPAVGAVWVGLEDGFFITLPGRGEIPDSFDPREDPVYRTGREAATVDWQVGPYGRLSATRAMVATSGSGRVHGVVGFDIDLEWVREHLLPRDWVGVPGVGGVLVDEGAMIVAATDLPNARALNPTLLEGMAEADVSGSPGYRIEDGFRTPQLFIFHRLPTMGWTHIIYGPLERLTSTTEPIVPGVGAVPDE